MKRYISLSKSSILISFIAIMSCCSPNYILADIVRGIDIDFTTIGNIGNDPDTQVMSDGTVGYGAVEYEYRIGIYEITNAQWNDFVASAGAPTGTPSSAYDLTSAHTGDQQPTDNVSWYEAMQFCNYLTSGDKSQGVYQFSGDNDNPADFLGIDRAAALDSYCTIYAIPTEDEWYKAAYYKPDGSGYSRCANGEGTVPDADNGWNYDGGAFQAPWDVGTGTMEQNGTFDMMGNLWELAEISTDTHTIIRGGTYASPRPRLYSTFRDYIAYPTTQSWRSGFRIVRITEPLSLTLLTPNDNEMLPNSKDIEIRWDSTGCIENVILSYTLDPDTGIWNIIDTVPNSGLYVWEPPSISSDKICILIEDATDSTVNDYSDIFTIYDCQKILLMDSNKDCYVNIFDFAIMASEWLECGNPFDPNCDIISIP